MPKRLPDVLPIGPLLAQMDLAHGPRNPWHSGSGNRRGGHHDGARDRLATLIGVGPRHAERFIAAGTIPDYHADRAALNLNLHPANIWPDEWAQLAADYDREHPLTVDA